MSKIKVTDHLINLLKEKVEKRIEQETGRKGLVAVKKSKDMVEIAGLGIGVTDHLFIHQIFVSIEPKTKIFPIFHIEEKWEGSDYTYESYSSVNSNLELEKYCSSNPFTKELCEIFIREVSKNE